MPSTSTDRLNGLTTSVAIKAPCKHATTGNITLSGLAVQAGGPWADELEEMDGEGYTRVFVWQQTNPVENGIYNPKDSGWQRAKDFDGNRDAVQGTLVPVYPASAGTMFYELQTANPVVIGTSEIEFMAADPGVETLVARLADTSSASNGGFMIGRGFPVVDSIAVLRTCLKTNPATRVFVTGYYAAGDGGGGAYYLDPADTTTVDDGGSVIVAADEGRWKLVIGDSVSVRQFGARGNNVANDSTAFNGAIATNRRVYVPKGFFRANVTANSRISMFGDGNTASILRPFSTATAIITYTYAAMSNPAPVSFFNFHSEVRDIGFESLGMTGVGFTFGKTDPADYEANDEVANNVRFPGCRFSDFDKGVQCPFGNIGENFKDCGFDYCRYAIYSMNNKFGGLMHAGNKYIEGGEMHRCIVGIYIHNSAGGFGGVRVRDTIFENGAVALYVYNAGGVPYTSLDLEGLWFENMGVAGGVGATVTIDAWTGNVRSDQVLASRAVILDGDDIRVHARGCGVLGDWWLKGTKIQVETDGCRVEGNSGYGGGEWTIDDPVTSYVAHHNPISDGGWRNGAGSYCPVVTGRMRDAGLILNPGSRSAGRVFNAPPRASKVADYGPSRAFSATLETSATTGNGSFNLTGSVVSDGRIYADCNEFTRAAFTSAQFTRLNSPDSSITTAAGWYVATLDMKIVSGVGVEAHVWDRSTVQLMAGATCNSVGRWHTLAAIGYSAGGQTLFLDFKGRDGNCTWRVSAYQLHRFDTLLEAQLFVASGAFAET